MTKTSWNKSLEKEELNLKSKTSTIYKPHIKNSSKKPSKSTPVRTKSSEPTKRSQNQMWATAQFLGRSEFYQVHRSHMIWVSYFMFQVEYDNSFSTFLDNEYQASSNKRQSHAIKTNNRYGVHVQIKQIPIAAYMSNKSPSSSILSPIRSPAASSSSNSIESLSDTSMSLSW